MEDNTFDKLKSMLNNGNIPSDLQNILSNMSKSDNSNETQSPEKSISPEAISNLMNMLNSKNNKRSKLRKYYR